MGEGGARSVAAAFEHAGTERRVGANDARVVDSTFAWYVVAGRISVFVQHDRGAHLGRRRFLGSVADGTLVWAGRGWSPPDDWRLLAVPEPETVVREVPADLLANGAAATAAEVGASRFAEALGEPDGAVDGPLLRRVVDDALTLQADEDHAAAESVAIRAGATAERVDDALAGLAGVTASTSRPGVSDQRDMIVSALGRLGDEIGVSFARTAPELDDPQAVLAELCRRSGVRRRTQSLAADWWKRAGVPFIGYVDHGRRPVAVFVRRSHWHLFDPRSGEERRVDGEAAAEFSPTAQALYPPLDDGEVSARSIARFALRQSWGDLRLLLGAGALAGLLALAIPVAVNIVYDSVIPAGDRWLLVSVVALLIGAGASATLASLSRNLALVRVQGVAQARLDPAVIDRLLRIATGEMRDWSAGDVANRIIGLQRIRNQLSGSVATAFLTLIFSSISLLLIFVYSPLLGVVATATVALAALVLVVLTRRWIRLDQEAFDYSGRVSALLYEAVGGISKVRVAGAQQRLVARWAELFADEQRAMFGAGRYRAWTIAVTTALPALSLLPVYLVVGTSANLASGQFLAAVSALGQLTGAVAAVSLSLSSVLISVPLWRRLQPVLQARVEPQGEAPGATLRGKIEVVGVTFGYDRGAPVLRGVSLVAEPGELIAVTGPSGAGKSTLLRLILGLETADEGSILYDGRDSSLLDMAALRRRIGVVSQNVRPIPGSIQEVITGAREGTSLEAWHAASAAGLADDIRRMPMGMNTLVTDQGAAFSGGQVQRLMIARALARRPAILLFDEATSALDGKTQAEVADRLADMAVTRIVIAHRLSTIRDADRIYVLDEGAFVEQGTFDELVAAGGEFARLAQRQLA